MTRRSVVPRVQAAREACRSAIRCRGRRARDRSHPHQSGGASGRSCRRALEAGAPAIPLQCRGDGACVLSVQIDSRWRIRLRPRRSRRRATMAEYTVRLRLVTSFEPDDRARSVQSSYTYRSVTGLWRPGSLTVSFAVMHLSADDQASGYATRSNGPAAARATSKSRNWSDAQRVGGRATRSRAPSRRPSK